MKIESYVDPVWPLPKPRIAYVIAGYLFGNCIRDYGVYKEDKKKTYRINMKCHEHFKAGMDYDIVFVDNGSDDHDGIEFMKQHGRYVERENTCFSFGAWKYAWETFSDEYDYFLFTEDDMVPAKDDWLKEIYGQFHNEANIGAVGNYMETRGPGSAFERRVMALARNQRGVMHNLDGGWTFTSSRVLRDVYKRAGGLLINAKYHPTENELLFQTPILECGYKLKAYIGFGESDRYYIHGGTVLEPGEEIKNDIETITPLINCNGVYKHDKLRNYFNWL